MYSKFRIISDGTVSGTKVYAGDIDITEKVSRVDWVLDKEGRRVSARIEIDNIPVTVETVPAEITGQCDITKRNLYRVEEQDGGYGWREAL